MIQWFRIIKLIALNFFIVIKYYDDQKLNKQQFVANKKVLLKILIKNHSLFTTKSKKFILIVTTYETWANKHAFIALKRWKKKMNIDESNFGDTMYPRIYIRGNSEWNTLYSNTRRFLSKNALPTLYPRGIRFSLAWILQSKSINLVLRWYSLIYTTADFTANPINQPIFTTDMLLNRLKPQKGLFLEDLEDNIQVFSESFASKRVTGDLYFESRIHYYISQEHIKRKLHDHGNGHLSGRESRWNFQWASIQPWISDSTGVSDGSPLYSKDLHFISLHVREIMFLLN